MKQTVGTAAAAVDLSGYPDKGRVGQTLMIQNLGPGNVYVDATNAVTADTGIKIGIGGGWEIQNWTGGSIYLISDLANTDVRIVAVG